MSTITPRQFTAKNGSAFTVRAAQIGDAAQVLALAKAIAGTEKYLMSQPDEFPQDVEEEKGWIRTHLEAPGQIALVADFACYLVGSLPFQNGHRRRNAHQGTFGLTVRQEYQRMGVGSAMLQCLLAWAAANPLIEKIGLTVCGDNVPAMALYQKYGFLEEGRQPRQVKLGPDEYQDLILMYRWAGGGP